MFEHILLESLGYGMKLGFGLENLRRCYEWEWSTTVRSFQR